LDQQGVGRGGGTGLKKGGTKLRNNPSHAKVQKTLGEARTNNFRVKPISVWATSLEMRRRMVS